jgi:transcriptional regulator with XRE-family HTH domain
VDKVSQVLGGPLLRRYIGRRFQKLRERADLNRLQAAEAWQRGRATLSRVEEGDDKVKFRDSDVEALCKLYGASPEETRLLLALTGQTRKPDNRHRAWQDYTEDELPTWFTVYLMLEEAAEKIRQYEAELIPGLFQTRAYAEELFRIAQGYPADETEIQRLATVRLERQQLLDQPDPPRMSIVLNEAVLRRPFGGPEVMAQQLGRVLELADRPTISVRIVPFAVGGHGGMAAQAFSILDFPVDETGEPIEPTLNYIDTVTGAMYLNKPEETRVYETIWRNLDERSLDGAASRDMIVTAMKGFSGG